ncbi:salivary glue protein Sgs-3 [Drosophila subpulchrella]|uniref:salivary glue protein Sgs-3 n=1 Tax=Drosophila subpulchrella TaxID=1486046 RepID=UPI0018A19544|nr:salivary glue protein Sgs-3 [Drosophila subpulchrella]
MFKPSMLLGLALILAPGSLIQAKSLCRQSGYFALVDNTADFYACQATGVAGDFSLRFLRCPAGLVFSSSVAHCVPSIAAFEAREDSNIENPTIPPSVDESTTIATTAASDAPSTTVKPATEATEATEKPATVAAETTTVSDELTTDEPATKVPVTDEPVTDEPVTDEPVTDKPATDEPVTDEPVTDEPVTDKPATDEPVTDEPVTDEPVTDETVTDEPVTDKPATDEPVTDEPITKTTDAGDVTKTTSSDVSSTTAEDNVCATTGFFPTDGSCTDFVICSYGNGTELKPYVRKCPNEMQFDPLGCICSKDYDCTKA